jgi:hypothetical protein
MYTATLHCGTVLEYEAPSFVPNCGEVVPCRHHGYCVSESIQQLAGGSRRGLARARPKTCQELLDLLRHRPETTIHALRGQRFTLRIIAALERDGHLTVDYRTGRVAARQRRLP